MNVIDLTAQLAIHRRRSRRRASDIGFIVIHHTASPKGTTPYQVHGWHLSTTHILSDGTRVRGKGMGYHAYIQADINQAFKCLPDLVIGCHSRGMNTPSIGICVSGDYQAQEPPDPVLDTLYELIKHYKTAYPAALVRGHREMRFSHTLCPGRFLHEVIVNWRKAGTI